MFRNWKQPFSLLVILLLCTQALTRNEEITQTLSTAITQFSVELNKILYQQSPKDGNVLFSPINIYTILAILHSAANGNSRTEIANLLKFTKDENQIQKYHEAVSQLLKTIENTTVINAFSASSGLTETKVTDINMANGIFVQKGINIKSPFAANVQSNYKGEIANVDFEKESSKTTEIINQYVSKNTKERIKTLFSQSLDTSIRALIVTVTYFKAIWDEPFYDFFTKDDKFNTGSGFSDVKMMSNTGTIPYKNLPSLNASSIELKYAGGDASIIYVLPNSDQTLDNLITSFTDSTINEIISKKEYLYVNYKIPKMKFKWSKDIVDVLQSLGLLEVFTDNADFSNMVTNSQLKISNVEHTTEIEVNEKGTEASAVTVAKLVSTSALFHPKPVEFVVNRSFVFLIYHRKTKAILFSGVVKQPNNN